jgi:hypothetical protein
MNAQQPTYVANPASALDLVDILIAGDESRLRRAADQAFQAGRLYDLDLACLVLIHVTLNHSANLGHLYANSAETWREVFDIAAKGKNSVASRFAVNPSWLGDDVIGFMQHCVLPAIGSGAPKIAVPIERGDAEGTPFDEVYIHVVASTFCAFSVLQGLAKTSPRFDGINSIVTEIRNYLEDSSPDGDVDILTAEEKEAEMQEEARGDRKAPSRSDRRATRVGRSTAVRA